MKHNNYGIYDFSDYAEEITGDDLFKGSGGPGGPTGPSAPEVSKRNCL